MTDPHPGPAPVLEQEWVSLDLETTGLDPRSEAIIEVGAVRFRGDETLDTFSSLVNPGRRLGEFIVGYTGISEADVAAAPRAAEVLPGLSDFVGSAPLVGHNLGFDLGFLEAAGLGLANPSCDTWELAYVLRPAARSYSLGQIAAELGIAHDRPHRALGDAAATARVFAALVREAQDLEADILSELDSLARRAGSPLARVTPGLVRAARGARGDGGGQSLGFDVGEIRRRTLTDGALRAARERRTVDPVAVAAALGEGGALARSMPGFEHRAEQEEMARAVAQAINESAAGGNGRLIVEGGTGVGKSLAYLLPAALYALANDARVVISTNTINLQEQLLSKDVPMAASALEAMGVPGAAGLRATQLKGRSNYLCLARLLAMRSGESASEAEARMVSKLLVWLRSTETGDRAELNLGRRPAAEPWGRLSAQGARDCRGVSGACFLRAARERAASSHLVVVNHALLMAHLATDGSILPEHDVLIIDEAHHLEESATKQLGHELSQSALGEHLSAIVGESGLLAEAAAVMASRPASDDRRQTVHQLSENVGRMAPGMRRSLAELLAGAGRMAQEASADGGGRELRVTAATRSQPAWSELETAWERADVSLVELGNALAVLGAALEDADGAGPEALSGLAGSTGELARANDEIRIRLRGFFPHPEPETVYWISAGRQAARRPADVVLGSAPLSVGEILEEAVYSRTGAVVLTSATLAADGSLEHLVDRTGFDHARHLIVGSPFDYERSALVCLPDDVPEPSSPAYQETLERAIVDAAAAAGGRTMALFTSYASLQRADRAIRPELKRRGIEVRAQGADGTPHRIVARFLDDPRSVILGTSSFWEGVDLSGESLQVLVVARLPFAVPTDPIVAARSELFEDAFRGYHVPQAVLRLRQGFGRLIRTGTDRGVAVIMDRRIVSKSYGRSFVRSLPPARRAQMPLSEVPVAIGRFLGTRR